MSIVGLDLKTHLNPLSSNHDAELSGTTADNGDGVNITNNVGMTHILFGIGAATGAPDSFTVTCKAQESADDSSYADCDTQSVLVLSADNAVGILRAHVTEKYVRGVMTPEFDSGTSPTVPGAFSVIMGQKYST